MTDVTIDPMRIRDRAYTLWLARGGSSGSAERDWLEAERAIVAEEGARHSQRADIVADTSPSIPPTAAKPADNPPPASKARSAARRPIAPSAAIPPTAVPPSARTAKPTMAAPPLEGQVSEPTKPPRSSGRRSSSARAARRESEAPPRSTTAPRAQKATKAAPKRVNRTG
jgi:hypothetical protein